MKPFVQIAVCLLLHVASCIPLHRYGGGRTGEPLTWEENPPAINAAPPMAPDARKAFAAPDFAHTHDADDIHEPDNEIA